MTATPAQLPDESDGPVAAAGDALPARVARLAGLLQAHGWMMATAESCTGGLIAAHCTEAAGASSWFERGFVTYSDAAKAELLGVSHETLARHGAVSEAVVREMAAAAVRRSQAQAAVAVSGVAGPGGGSPEKPVGLVCFGYAVGKRVLTESCHFAGDRQAVRQATVHHALGRLAELIAARPV
ncbi:MAG: CinA family protein [Comamonas sp.]